MFAPLGKPILGGRCAAVSGRRGARLKFLLTQHRREQRDEYAGQAHENSGPHGSEKSLAHLLIRHIWRTSHL
jgi:hypothetical protein